jgi:hypothetical protein
LYSSSMIIVYRLLIKSVADFERVRKFILLYSTFVWVTEKLTAPFTYFINDLTIPMTTTKKCVPQRVP